MPPPGALQAAANPASGIAADQQMGKSTLTASSRVLGLDSSGADMDAIDSYLQQLLPALASALNGSSTPEGVLPNLASLGLDRAALLAAGVPQHTINALYRSMSAHAGAFKKLVAGEVQQLRQLLSQHAAPQLQGTIQLLDGPIASTTTQNTLKSGRTQAMQQSLQQQQEKQQQALTATAAEAISAGGGGNHSLLAANGLGPSADELVKDYADAYASMKETMEVRLRHEQRRGDFLHNKLQQTEASFRDLTAQFEAANRHIAELRLENSQLADQVAGLQSDLAASHAAHLALQQHHKETMEQAATEKQRMEELHKKTVETLQADLTAAGGVAAALADTSRQVEALRLLYNEELSRASRLAVELTRATAAADKAAAEEDGWRRQLQKSDSRADNAEGMAEAMKVNVSQLEQELLQEKIKLEAKRAESAKLRLLLERSRLAAVEQRALAQATVITLSTKVESLNGELATKQSTLSTTEDNLKLKAMELEGANAQLQASRTHMKQLMSDIESGQEQCTDLSTALADMKQQAEGLTAAKEIAEGRLKTLQIQLSKANDSSVMMSEQLNEARTKLEDRIAQVDELEDSLQAEQAAHSAVREQAGRLKTQVAELQIVEQRYGQLQLQHEEASSKLDRLEQENLDLTAKARQLQVATEQLQQLQGHHAKVKSKLVSVKQQLQVTTSNLEEEEELRHRSEAQVVLLQDRLEHADVEQQQLARQLLAVTTAGDGAQHQIEQLQQQLEAVQSSLETAEADRQALAAQRDGWMASFQEAYGKLQEWTSANQAASKKLAGRASIVQTAMQQLSSQLIAENDATDSLITSGRSSVIDSRTSVLFGSTDGLSASAVGAGSAESAAVASQQALPGARVSVATTELLDQMTSLQQLMQAEATKHQEVYGDTLEALSRRVQERSEAAQAWWQETMAAANKRRAARATATAAARKKHSLAVMAAAQRASLAGGSSSSLSAQQSLQMLPLVYQPHHQPLEQVAEGLDDLQRDEGLQQSPAVNAAAASLNGGSLQLRPQAVETLEAPAQEHSETAVEAAAAGAMQGQQQLHSACASTGAAAGVAEDKRSCQTDKEGAAAGPGVATTSTCEDAGSFIPAAAAAAGQLSAMDTPDSQQAPQEASYTSAGQQQQQQQVEQQQENPSHSAPGASVSSNEAGRSTLTNDTQSFAAVAEVDRLHADRPARVTSTGQAAAAHDSSAVQLGQFAGQATMTIAQQARDKQAACATQQEVLSKQQLLQQTLLQQQVSPGLQQQQQQPAYQQLQRQHQLLQQQYQLLLQQVHQQQGQQQQGQQQQGQQQQQQQLQHGRLLSHEDQKAAVMLQQSKPAVVQPIQHQVLQQPQQQQLQQQQHAPSAGQQHQEQHAQSAVQQQQQQTCVSVVQEGQQSQAQQCAATAALPAGPIVAKTAAAADDASRAAHPCQPLAADPSLVLNPSSSSVEPGAVIATGTPSEIQQHQQPILCTSTSQSTYHQLVTSSIITTTTTTVTTRTSSSASSSSDSLYPGAPAVEPATAAAAAAAAAVTAEEAEASSAMAAISSTEVQSAAAPAEQAADVVNPPNTAADVGSRGVSYGSCAKLPDGGNSSSSSNSSAGIHEAHVVPAGSVIADPATDYIPPPTVSSSSSGVAQLHMVMNPDPTSLQGISLWPGSTAAAGQQASVGFIPGHDQDGYLPQNPSMPHINFASSSLVTGASSMAIGYQQASSFQGGLLQSSSSSVAGLDSPGSSPASGGLPGGGYLSGFVSMVAYQEQMKSVATLHSQVGEMAVQLREAHADAEGAQQQLQQERQEATVRTTALRGALGQLHTQMDELQCEHEALQQAHRQLVAKDLMKSGILKDRYVADLFARLQEAEWRLDVARKRACTWGFEMMVPLGRVDRGIQTQYAEVWASEQQQQQQQQGLTVMSPSQASIQRRLQQGAMGSAAAAAAVGGARPLSGGSSRRVHLDPLTDAAAAAAAAAVGMSAAVSTAAAGAAGRPVVGSVGSLGGGAEATCGSGNLHRKKPAFAQHSSAQEAQSHADTSSSSLVKRPASAADAHDGSSSSSGNADEGNAGAALYSAAEQLLAAGDVETLPAAALLQLIGSIYSAKAAADATALVSHSPPAALWDFMVKQLQRKCSSKRLNLTTTSSSSSSSKDTGKSTNSSSSSSSSSKAVAAALAQLLGSIQQHSTSSKEIAQFSQALSDSWQQSLLLAQARTSSITRSSSPQAAAHNNSSSSGGSSAGAVTIKGSWDELRLDNNKVLPLLPDLLLLLPDGLHSVLERVLLWPGMMVLLGWVAQGHFLCGLQEGSLGKTLMDVQAPHVHFLLLETADIMGLHPLPRVQLIQAAAPFVRLLRVPRVPVLPPATAAVGTLADQQQQQQAVVWQQDSLLVVSSAALQLLAPAELQAALAAALVPAMLAGGHADDGDGSSSSSAPQRNNAPGFDTLSPSHTPGLCELATLSSLLALQPAYLLAHLPAQMHAMGGALAAALQAAERLVAAAGDRGGLLVSQDLGASVAALVKTGKGIAAAASSSGGRATGSSSGCSSSTLGEGVLQEWLQKVQDAESAGCIPNIEQLLPNHGRLQQVGTSSNSSSTGDEMDRQQLADAEVLLLRVKGLVDWSDSELYKQIMAAAKPLRRLMAPGGRRLPSA